MNTTLNINTWDIAKVRADFPVLHQSLQGKPLVYFDNAATTQKPQVVIDAIVDYYQGYNANIHRGIHTLAEKATAAYELTRDTIKAMLNAAHREEIIFTSGTTQSINLVAQTFGKANLKPGDEVLISGMEHHSNIVPWQMICKEKGASLKVIPVTDSGELDLEAFENMLSEKTKILAIVYVSNSLGTINPVKWMTEKAHNVGAKVLIDGAQSTSHLDIDVQDLDCDFYVFSAHKLYGPTGVGALYGKKELLEAMPPYQGGGEMIKDVTFEKTTYNELPYKFEAGTPNIADTVAFNAAINYLTNLGKNRAAAFENELLKYGTSLLESIDGVKIIGQAKEKISVLSFVVEGVHPQDIGIMLDLYGVAIRTGHHCTQPLMDRFKIPGTCRASLAFYNTSEELDIFAAGLRKAISKLK
jgi:cysteine desulfurase/selenocysteine lyase